MYRDFGIGTIQSKVEIFFFFFPKWKLFKNHWGGENKIEPIQSFLLDYIILKYGIFTRFWIWVNLDFAEIKDERNPTCFV